MALLPLITLVLASPAQPDHVVQDIHVEASVVAGEVGATPRLGPPGPIAVDAALPLPASRELREPLQAARREVRLAPRLRGNRIRAPPHG